MNMVTGIPKAQIESISNERTKEHTGGADKRTVPAVGILKIKKSGIMLKVVQHLGNTYGGRTEFTNHQ